MLPIVLCINTLVLTHLPDGATFDAAIAELLQLLLNYTWVRVKGIYVCMCVCSPYVTDSSIAITVCVLLFMLPSQAPNYLCFKSCNQGMLSLSCNKFYLLSGTCDIVTVTFLLYLRSLVWSLPVRAVSRCFWWRLSVSLSVCLQKISKTTDQKSM